MRVLFILVVGFCFNNAQKALGEAAAQGELKLEGKHIKKVVLEREDSNKVAFDKPGESIKLAVGKYILREVQLEGGYVCRYPRDSSIEIGEDKPAVLKVGAPLKQIVEVSREDRVLRLDYGLLGIGGEEYVNSDSNKPPAFTVYKGDKKIASGTFKYL
jgi:hypothetical protein